MSWTDKPTVDSRESQRALMSTVIYLPSLLSDMVMMLDPEVFDTPYRWVYEVAIELDRSGITPDEALIRQSVYLKYPEAAGVNLDFLTDGDATAAMNWQEHARIVLDAHVVRSVVIGAQAVARGVLDGDIDPDSAQGAILEFAEQVALARRGRGKTKSATDITDDFLAKMDKAMLGSDRLSIPTHVPGLDSAFGSGWRTSQLTTIFGESGSGKSLFVLWSTLMAALRNGVNVLNLSLEMPGHEIVERYASVLTGIPVRLTAFEHGDRALREADYKALLSAPIAPYLAGRTPERLSELCRIAGDVIRGLPISTYDRPVNMSKAISIVQSYASTHPGSVVVLDHIMRIDPEKRETEYEMIKRAMNMLANMTMQFPIALIVVTQPNRALKEGEKPTLGHMAFAGEKPSQVVLGLQQAQNATGRIQSLQVHILKGRSSARGAAVSLRVDYAAYSILEGGV